jgi:hypothetical protein
MKTKKAQTFRPHYFGTQHRDDGLCVGSSREGRCYELAGAAVLTTLVDASLVHGSIRVPGSNDADPYLHAWVVLADGQVWEPTQARLWDAGLFWCVMQPVVTARYGHAELLAAVRHTGHWGPWR